MFRNRLSSICFSHLLGIFLVVVLGTTTAYAAGESHIKSRNTQAIASDLLVGADDITGARLAYRPYIYELSNVPFFDKLHIYWEMSVNFWEYGQQNDHDTNFVLALSPVVSKTFYYIQDTYPLKWEFGIGVSLVNDTRFAGKDIGSHYQFEDRLGLTVDLGEDLTQSISLRYMHYSNGGLNSKNPGVDFLNMSYAFNF